MYVKIEPSGCCERKGMVQVRLSMYLEPGDYNYDAHHVKVPDFGGKVWEGDPEDKVAKRAWIDTLPHFERDNPFHNHFIYVDPDTTDEEIMDIAEAFLHEAGMKWSMDLPKDLKNKNLPFRLPKKPETVPSWRKEDAAIRAEFVKMNKSVRQIDG